MRFPSGLVIIIIGWIISAIMKQNSIRSQSRTKHKTDTISKSFAGGNAQTTTNRTIWPKKESAMDEFFAQIDHIKEEFFADKKGSSKKKENMSHQPITNPKDRMIDVETANDEVLVPEKTEKNVRSGKKAQTVGEVMLSETVIKPKKKRSKLQKAIIYSEVIGKPKSLRHH